MKIAKETLNPYAQAVEEAQGEIRILVKQAFIQRLPQGEVNKRLQTIVEKATSGIVIERLKDDTRISLLNFANKQRMIWQSSGLESITLMLLGKAISGWINSGELLSVAPSFNTVAKGVPLQRYYNNVWKERVQPVIDKLVRAQALDPNDFTGRNSLRNLAEMEVRYHDHQDSIDSLKNGGVKLVVCSAHADCSKRCAEWQGRIYSLDGTSGVVDGHKYVPLETATDVWYTTKAGRRYKNGLLGFNCRHQISEYKGYVLPTVKSEERKKEYAVTLRQRELEREVRRAKAFALEFKGISDKDYKAYKNKAQRLYNEYIKFCADNNRAYYPMRVSI